MKATLQAMFPVPILHDAGALAWNRRWALLKIQAAFVVLTWGLLSPLAGVTMQLAVRLSGEPVLTDMDIARFLATPLGLTAAIAALSLAIVFSVLALVTMIEVLQPGRRRSTVPAIVATFGALPRLLAFTALLIVLVALITVPFAAAVWLIVAPLLETADINYYLTHKPPEAIRTAIGIGVLMLICVVLLLNRLAAWLVAPVLVLFNQARARQAFAQSASQTRGRRLSLVAAIIVAVVASVAIAGLLLFTIGMTLRPLLALGTPNLLGIALILMTGLVVWTIAGLIVSAGTNGVIAAILLKAYSSSEAGGDVPPRDPAAPEFDGESRVRAVLIVALVAAAGTAIGGALLADGVARPDNVEIIAHRGAAGSRPENTLAAFEKAIEDGADWIELDVQETADDEVVVIHDGDLMKLAGMPLRVHEAAMEELTKIDVGSWYDPAYADARVPTLQEVLEHVRGRAKVLIELKHYGHARRLEERVADIVEKADMVADVAIMSLDAASVARMKELRPNWRVGLLAAALVGKPFSSNADFLAVRAPLAASAFVRRARRSQKPVLVWTVNDPIAMSTMISRGVSGLITDEPGMAHRVLAARAEMGMSERAMLMAAHLFGLPSLSKRYRDQSP